MPQNDIQESLLAAMDIIASSGDKTLQFDRTIECEVIKPVDASTGEYKVRYLDGTFSAYDTSLKMSYKVGSTVYVQIPRNDMSLKKLIIGSKSTSSSDLIDSTQDIEKVDKVGIPLEDIYPELITSPDIGIIGSTSPNRTYFIYLYNPAEDTTNIDSLFRAYAKDQKIILLSAKFKNSWLTDKVSIGNFGLEFIFETEAEGTQSFILDRSNMTGNPMKYSTFTTAYALLEIDGSKLTRLKEVRFFAENFQRDDYQTEQELRDIWNLGKGDSEIWVQDVSASFAQVIEEVGFTGNIITPDGIFFEGKQELRLSGQLKYNGRTDTIDEKKIKYYWFEQNAQVSLNSPLYNELGGVGWYKLPAETRDFVLTIHQFNPLAFNKKYKLVMVYEDIKTISQVMIYRSYKTINDYELHLDKNVNGTGTLTVQRTGQDQTIPTDYIFTWMSVDTNNVSQEESPREDDPKKLDIDIANILNGKTFYCTISSSSIVDGTELTAPIMTLSRTIYNLSMRKDFDVLFETDNDGFFTYDVNGDMYLDNLLKQLRFNIVWRDEADKEAYKYKWVVPDTFENQMYEVPAEAVLEGDSDTPDNKLDYEIKTRFDYSKSENNLIKLELTMAGEIYIFTKMLQFTKEGDPGTNGTSLIMQVVPFSTSGFDVFALKDKKDDTIQLKVQLFYNGLSSYNSTNVNSYFNLKTTIPREFRLDNPLYNDTDNTLNVSIEDPVGDDATGIITIKNLKDLNLNPSNGVYNFNSIIQIKATPKTSSGAFSYPVFGLYGIPLTNSINLRNGIVSGAKRVLYNTQGFNPQFDETSYKLILTGQDNGDLDFNIFNVNNSSGYILSIPEYKIVPNTKYDETAHGGIVFQDANNLSDIFIQPIVFTLNAYSQGLLNAWDGSSLEIDKEKNHVLAAQIGAGTKNASNQFSGVLMGSLIDENSKKTTGLMGFQDGIVSFQFLEDGSAILGKAGKGQIIFKPGDNDAIIQSGNYQDYTSTTEDLVLNNSYQNINLALENYVNSNIVMSVRDSEGIQRCTNYSARIVKDNIVVDDYRAYVVLEERSETITTNINVYYETVTDAETGNQTKVLKKQETVTTMTISSKLINSSYENNTTTKTDVKDPINANEGEASSSTVTKKNYTIQCNLFNSSMTGLYLVQITKQEGQSDVVTPLSKAGYVTDLRVLSSSGNGMKINLDKGSISAADLKLKSSTILIDSVADEDNNRRNYAISVGQNREFYIRHDGTGKVGGWSIDADSIHAGKTYLNSDGTIRGASISGSEISGTTINGGTISGTTIEALRLECNQGYIGGWEITPDGLTSEDGNIYLYHSGEVQLGDRNFKTIIDADGISIGGKKTASTATITSNGLSVGQPGKGTFIDTDAGIITQQLTIMSSTSFTTTGQLGYVGLVYGEDDYGATYNIGIQSSVNSASVVLSSERNIGLRTAYGIYVTAQTVDCSNVDKFIGVYATLA